MRTGLILSVALFILACCLPALEFRNSHGKTPPMEVMTGLNALAVGWSGIFAGVFAWYANPVWFVALILALMKKAWPATVAGSIAVVIALTTFTLLGRELPGDEGNVTRTTVVRLLPGCYAWFASLFTIPICALLTRFK